MTANEIRFHNMLWRSTWPEHDYCRRFADVTSRGRGWNGCTQATQKSRYCININILHTCVYSCTYAIKFECLLNDFIALEFYLVHTHKYIYLFHIYLPLLLFVHFLLSLVFLSQPSQASGACFWHLSLEAAIGWTIILNSKTLNGMALACSFWQKSLAVRILIRSKAFVMVYVSNIIWK